MNTKTRFMTVGLSLLAAGAGAHGQAILVSQFEETEANAWVWEWNGNVNNNYGIDQANSGLDYNHAEYRTLQEHGYDGYGNAWRDTPFTPSNPGLGGSFLGFGTNAGAEACQFASDFGNHQEEGSWGQHNGTLKFDVLTPMNWSWQGNWQGQSLNAGHYFNAHGELHFKDAIGGGIIINEVRDSLMGVGDWNEPISFGGTLFPGTYEISWEASVEIWGWHGAQLPLGCVPTFMSGNFSLSPIPAPGAAAVLGIAGLAATRRRR